MDSYRHDGLTFDVRDEGPRDGETVVLLHGYPEDSSAWSLVAPLLHDAGFRTLAGWTAPTSSAMTGAAGWPGRSRGDARTGCAR